MVDSSPPEGFLPTQPIEQIQKEAHTLSGNVWLELNHQNPRDRSTHPTDLSHHEYLKDRFHLDPSVFVNRLSGRLHTLQSALNPQNKEQARQDPLTHLLISNGANAEDLSWFVGEMDRVVREGALLPRTSPEVTDKFDIYLNDLYKQFHKEDNDEAWRFSDATRQSMRNILYFIKETADHTMTQNEINANNNYLQPLRSFATFLRLQLKSEEPPTTEEKRQELIAKAKFSPTRDMLPDQGVSSKDIPRPQPKYQGTKVMPLKKGDDWTKY